jgi:putative acetyltransferase
MLIERIVIRAADAGEDEAIHAVQTDAFGRREEADLTLALIADPVDTLSFVATLDGRLVGHVLYSGLGGSDRALALAPLGVVTDMRDCGIGSALVRHSLATARTLGWKSVFVLGEPGYYERFGFTARAAADARCPWAGPNFMALELQEGALAGFSGELRYAAPFGGG